jgi:acetolactate synthase-1/2/3 large subunit
MSRMTGNRYFAEAVRAYGVTHVFFVPTIMLPAMAEMEDMGIRREYLSVASDQQANA